MNQFAVALVVALGSACSVYAQAVNPHNGNWKISFDGKRTVDLEGTVVVKDEGGVWHIAARASRDPCVGREYPITVQKANVDELVFVVNRSKTLTGCKDSTYTFTKTDEGTLKGDLGGGRAAVLVRN